MSQKDTRINMSLKMEFCIIYVDSCTKRETVVNKTTVCCVKVQRGRILVQNHKEAAYPRFQKMFERIGQAYFWKVERSLLK